MTGSKKRYKYDISIYANFRDEAPYLYEWVVYHLLIGVSHFYLYNHLSKDNYLEVLQPFIEKGIITLHQHNSVTPPKFINYKKCIKEYKDETQWIAFIDLDEYVVVKDNNNLRSYMEGFENYNGVGLCWLYYGNNNIQKQDDRLVFERFPMREKISNIKTERLFKTIADPRQIDTNKISNPHYFHYKDGKFVDEKYSEIGAGAPGAPEDPAFTCTPSYENAYIAHYKRKSLEEFINRNALMPRDDGVGPNQYRHSGSKDERIKSATKYWHSTSHVENEIEDTHLFSFVNQITNFDLDEYCNSKRKENNNF